MTIEHNSDHTIAGFTKTKLLELCDLCNIANGIAHEKSIFNAEDKKKKQADLSNFIESGGEPIPFFDIFNRCVGFVFIKGKEVIIAYRGTLDIYDMLTDVSTIYAPIKFLPKGAVGHSGFYAAAKNLFPGLADVLMKN